MATIALGSHLFTPEALTAAIAKTDALQQGKKGALIGTIDANGVSVALVMAIGEHVEVQGAVAWTPGTHDVAAGAKVIASW